MDQRSNLVIITELFAGRGRYLSIGEFHIPEDLARDRVYEFCYVAATNKIKGAAAGFTMRPIAIH